MRVSEILFAKVAEENNHVLNGLKEVLQEKKGNWMLCLGAGVSLSAKLPNWNRLLAKITAQLLPVLEGQATSEGVSSGFSEGLKDFYADVSYTAGFSEKFLQGLAGKYEETFANINVLEAAEYIRNVLVSSLREKTDSENNEKELKNRVNLHMNKLIQQACELPFPEGKFEEEMENSTLAAVARLMKSEKDQLIHNVITYNYDNLLETYLRRVSGCDPHLVHSIVKGDDIRAFDNNEGWNIYHVHGRVPVIPCLGEEMSENVILTESDYYQEEQINYSWANILQSYAMIHSNLIFVGFSGADYNFRRIVKYVDKENSISNSRYIFFLVDDIVNAVFKEQMNAGNDIEEYIKWMNMKDSEYAYEKLFINYLIQAKTVYWRKHGLNVIWSSRDELYENLESLH